VSKQIEIRCKLVAKFDLLPQNYAGEFKDAEGNLIEAKVIEYELEAVKDDPEAFFSIADWDGEDPTAKIVEETE